MRHRRILDVAEEHPDLSMDELASMVPSATTELVERVLEKYGDPAENGDPSEPATADGSGAESATADDDAPADETGADANGEADADVGGSDDDGFQEEGAETAEQADDGPTDDRSTDGGSVAAKNGDEPVSTPTVGGDVTPGDSAPSGVEGSEYPSPESLTEKQRRTLRAVAERPDATQEELGSELDVCAATVSNRLNRIDGFEWHDREAFVRGVFGDGQSTAHPSPDSQNGTESASAPEESSGVDSASESAESAEVAGSSPATPAAQESSGTDIPVSSHSPTAESTDEPSDETDPDGLEKRVAAIEDKLANSEGPISPPVFDDPELLHKVVHACMRAETISEEEELRILKALLR